MMRKFFGLVSVAFIAFFIFAPLAANAATISGWVVNETDNVPVPWSFLQLHKKDVGSGYLTFVGGFSSADGNYSFELPEPINFADAVFEEYLLEAKAENYTLSRVPIFFDSVNDIVVNVTLTSSAVVLELTLGQMMWDENLTTLSWPIPLKNQTTEKQRVLVHAVYNGPVTTDFWSQFPAFSGIVSLDPSSCKEEVFSIFVPSEAVPEGYSVCLWVFVTKVGDPFTMYDGFYDCALKSHVQPTSPPTKG